MHYLYCVVQGELARSLAGEVGLVDTAVYSLSHDGLTVVLSDVPEASYEQTRRNMLAHTRIQELVLAQQEILPVRFNTVAPTKQAIYDKLLIARHDELVGLFGTIHGRVELGLKAYWYEERLFDDVLAENEPIRVLRDQLQGTSEAESYYERIRLGEMIEAAIDAKRERERAQILDKLVPLAEKHRLSHIGTERMVLNASFLLPRAREKLFDTAVEELDQALGQRMKFKYIGPVPPYNFVNLIVHW